MSLLSSIIHGELSICIFAIDGTEATHTEIAKMVKLEPYQKCTPQILCRTHVHLHPSRFSWLRPRIQSKSPEEAFCLRFDTPDVFELSILGNSACAFYTKSKYIHGRNWTSQFDALATYNACIGMFLESPLMQISRFLGICSSIPLYISLRGVSLKNEERLG